jgi:hypothetical protein
MQASKVSCEGAFSWHAARLAPPYTRRADPATVQPVTSACALISEHAG